MKKVTILSNAVNAKLHEADRDVRLAVQNILSYNVEGAEHSIQFKRGHWDGRSSFLDFKAGTFPAGFTHFVAAHLRRQGYEIQHVKKPLPPALGPDNPVVDAFPEDPRYEYQMEVVKRLEKHGQIIAQVATGGGKSRIAKLAFARIGRPAMFLTTRGILMYQMHEAFERDLGITVSILGDGKFGHTIIDEHGRERQAVKRMSVAMVQTLMSRLEEKTIAGEIEKILEARAKKELKDLAAYRKKMGAKLTMAACDAFEAAQEKERTPAKTMNAQVAKKVNEHMAARSKTIELLKRFELVILEEAHEASGNSYFEILRHCTNAHYRLALTATPFMKDSQESNMRLMACSGPIAIKVTEKMLIDRGILAKPYFTFIAQPEKPKKLFKHTPWSSAYRIGIVENEWRNNAIVARCVFMAGYGLTSMVLVQQTAHGDNLLKLFLGAGLRAMFIQGEDDQAGRKAALGALAARKVDVLIGTTILDVGVDVPAVGHVCLAGGGKAEVNLRQRIGRGLRAKKTGPNVCFITDFHDEHNNSLRGHSKARQAIIQGTEGFAEGVLGGEVNLEKLGFALEMEAA